MIPVKLSDWTIDVVKSLVEKRLFETEYFDFKERLPDSRDERAKRRLRRTCVSFANSQGGFIVVGVKDGREIPLDDRIIGLSNTIDFPEHFGNYPKSCSPTVYWDFLNPPIELPNGNLIHVVHIPSSWNSPHSIGSDDDGWYFGKRTNKGNEGMDILEIRSNFLGYHEKRLKLQLLRAEITMARELATNSYIEDEDIIESQYKTITFDTSVIESVISDTYSITATDQDLVEALSALRQVLRVGNNKIHILFSKAALPLSNNKATIKTHNLTMKSLSESILELSDRAIAGIDRILR